MPCRRPNKYFGRSIWHVMCSAAFSRGQPRQVLFLEMGKARSASPKTSLQLSLMAEGRSQVAPGSTHFLNVFCTVNSWWFLFTVNRLPELVYFGSIFAPSVTLVDSQAGVQFCPQAFGIRRNLFPNYPRNGASSQAE